MKVNLLVLFCAIACLTLVSAVSGALVAEFSGSPTEGSAPLTVTFIDASVNATSWSWDFGDEEISNEQSPSHTYSTAGIYTVALTATNDNESDAESKSSYITVNEAEILPIAGFTASVTSGNIPLSVSFTDESEHATSWSWDFGDGSTSSLDQNTTHVFTTNGTFTVTLTATNENGSTQETVTITVINPLESSFTSSPISGPAPLNVTFTDGSTPSAYIDTYSWNFGDGSATSSEQNPIHNFTTANTYSVTLVVSNTTYGISDSYTGPIVVSSSVTAAPVAAFSANETSGPAPLAVLFTDESTGTVEGWTWEIYDSDDSEIESAYTENFTYLFEDEGIYTITLIVSNDIGSNTTTKTDYITVGDVPSISFTATPMSGYAPLSVAFNDTSTGNITTRLWDLDDGKTSSSQKITHTFSSAGTYTVKLSVSNDVGTVNATKTITVLSPSATPIPTPVPTPAPTYAGTSYDADATGLTAVAVNVSESSDDGGILFHNPLTEEIWKFYSFYLEYMKYLKGTVGITGEVSNSS